MSGGHFDYAYSKVQDFVEALDRELAEATRQDALDPSAEPYSEPATTFMVLKIRELAEKTARLMKEVELYYSGDNGDASFQRNVLEIGLPDVAPSPAAEPDFWVSEQHGTLLISRDEPNDPAYKWQKGLFAPIPPDKHIE